MYEADYTNHATCVLLANDPLAQVHWRAAAALLGIGPFTAPVGGLFDRAALPMSCALIVVDLSDTDTDRSDILLHEVDRWCRQTGGAAVVSFGLADIDRVAAAVESECAILLCDPDQSDRIVALATALPPQPNRVAEVDPIANMLRLQQLADEVGRIARALAQGAGEPNPTDRSVSDVGLGYRPPPSVSQAARAEVKPADIRAILRLRRQREPLFGAELFADPAWDMMLDLAAARLEHVDVAISSLCIAAAVPPTTALRWIRTLTDLRIFERRSDVRDGRRIFVALADDAAIRLIDFLSRAKASGAMPV